MAGDKTKFSRYPKDIIKSATSKHLLSYTSNLQMSVEVEVEQCMLETKFGNKKKL